MKIHVSHILTEHKFEAEDVERKLKQGEAFDVLAKKFSKCPSSQKGGDLGSVESSRFDADFEEAALALKAGDRSGIVRTRFGYHLIQRHS